MNYEDFLLEKIKSSDKLVVMTAENRAAIRTLPLQIKERFIDTGITEQTMIGMAAGLALRGKMPIVHALASFLTMRAFEFIRTDIGIGNLNVKLVGAVAGFLSEANGPTHQALEDISIMKGIPNMNIFAPSDSEDLVMGLDEILKTDSPWYIRFNNLPPAVKHHRFEIGKAEVLYEGEDVTILTYGCLLREAMLASEKLNIQGISTGVVNVRTLKPIERKFIIDVCSTTNLVVVLEDHFANGGLFSIISEILAEEFYRCRILPISLNNWFKPAELDDVLAFEGFNADQITAKIKTEMERIETWQTKLL